MARLHTIIAAACVTLAASAELLAACGLDENGGATSDAGVDVTIDQSGPDASKDAFPTDIAIPDVPVDNSLPPPCVTVDASCIPPFDYDAGWVPIGIKSGTATCPGSTDFTTINRISDPVALAQACTCGCNTVGTPSCAADFKLATYLSATVCTGSATGFGVSGDGGCESLSLDTTEALSGTSATTVSGGSCNPTATGDAGYTATNIVGCEPTACAADFCGLTGAGFTTCIASTTGANTCPSGFNTPIFVSSAAFVSCTACGCNLRNTGCAPGTLTAHNNGSCGGNSQAFPMNGSCNVPTGTYGSVDFQPGEAGAVVCATDAATPNAFLLSKQLVCCK